MTITSEEDERNSMKGMFLAALTVMGAAGTVCAQGMLPFHEHGMCLLYERSLLLGFFLRL